MRTLTAKGAKWMWKKCKTSIMVNAQEWLDQNYPKEKRSEVEEIHLSEPSLEGELDLGDFTYRDTVGGWGYLKILISICVEETNLIFINLPEASKIIKLGSAQEHINQQYPTKQDRTEVKKLDIDYKDCEGNLDLSDFSNLRKLNCSSNKLTSLNVVNCSKLEKIDCSDNLLTNITLPTNFINLKKLNLSYNNFNKNLSFLTPATNLEELYLQNNKFTGSLDYFNRMKQLKKLDISNTDLNEVNIDKLPESLENIQYFVEVGLGCKLVTIVPQLRRYEYGLCQKCRQFNTSRNWCQSCKEREWQKNIEKLSRQELIKKFIWEQCLKDSGKEEWQKSEFEWIPYEQFFSIEYLAEGGFSKVYKAKWKEKRKYNDFADEEVALKFLTNSQNITLEFLTEIANTKLVDNNNYIDYIVKFYGISQDPETKSYVMVMDYKKDGNLRQHLQSKFSELSLEYRVRKLESIANGLEIIHKQGLVHRDFHLGNILSKSDTWCYITDLGLCQPASFQKEENKIFGVLPYVAPEVLQGQSYTQASDIYSFGIVTYELFANAYPYPKMDELGLALKVCQQGYRPNVNELKIPQLLKDLIKGCWDTDPNQRPNAEELKRIISGWCRYFNKRFGVEQGLSPYDTTQFPQQYRAIVDEYNRFYQTTPYQIYSTVVVCSKPINTKQIIELVKKLQKSEGFSSQLNEITEQIKEIENKLEKFKNSLDSELLELMEEFIEVKKQSLKDKESEEQENKAWDLEAKLEEKGLVKEKDEITRYCEDLVALEQQISIKTTGLNTEIGNLSVRIKEQLSFSSQNESLPQSKYTKLTEILEVMSIEEKQGFQNEPIEVVYIPNQNWKNINSNFTDELIQHWQYHGFACQSVREWADCFGNNFHPQDYEFFAWLVKVKGEENVNYSDPIWVLNHGDIQNLNQEFFQWGQEKLFQTNVEQFPK